MARIYRICLYLLLGLFVYSEPTYAKSSITEFSTPEVTSPKDDHKRIQELEQRLRKLEPPEPTTIVDSPFPFEKGAEKHFPTDTLPIPVALKEGTKIPFNVIVREPDYIRPIYEEQWHSTYWGGRWSYVPSRIHYAQHRIFPFYAIGISAELNFQMNVGIAFPTSTNETDLDLYIVVFQTNVTEIYTKGNQVVVVGTPARNGVDVISIKTGDVNPNDKEKYLLVQLTSDEAELDYSFINYQPPDFWFKQKQKAEEQ